MRTTMQKSKIALAVASALAVQSAPALDRFTKTKAASAMATILAMSHQPTPTRCAWSIPLTTTPINVWIALMKIERKYIVDEHNRKIAVQLDIATFKIIEETLENYALFNYMQQDGEDNERLDINQANIYYQNLEKLK